MKPFLLRGVLTTEDVTKLWGPVSDSSHPPCTEESAHEPQQRERVSSGLDTAADPSVYIDILRRQYSIRLSQSELSPYYARAWNEHTEVDPRVSPSRRLWPEWLFKSKDLQRLIGTRVAICEHTTPPVFGATYVWVGIPCMTIKPDVADILHGNRDRFFSRHMLTLVTFSHPDAAHKYIWCTINCDGDTIPVDNDFLRVLLADEIAEIKTYVRRTGDRSILNSNMASGSESASHRDLHINAAKMMSIRFEGVPTLSTTFVPAELPAVHEPVLNVFAPISIAPVPDRLKISNIVHKSVAKKLQEDGHMPNPFLVDSTDAKQREKMRKFLCYFIHHGQFEPSVKDALAQSPHNGSFDEIKKDPAFVDYMRVMGNLFISQSDA